MGPQWTDVGHNDVPMFRYGININGYISFFMNSNFTNKFWDFTKKLLLN